MWLVGPSRGEMKLSNCRPELTREEMGLNKFLRMGMCGEGKVTNLCIGSTRLLSFPLP